jgi:hypothetical protein
MKRVFEIETPDDFGPMWMNKDNLLRCLTSTDHCRNYVVKVNDITDKLQESEILGAVSRGYCDPKHLNSEKQIITSDKSDADLLSVCVCTQCDQPPELCSCVPMQDRSLKVRVPSAVQSGRIINPCPGCGDEWGDGRGHTECFGGSDY